MGELPPIERVLATPVPAPPEPIAAFLAAPAELAPVQFPLGPSVFPAWQPDAFEIPLALPPAVPLVDECVVQTGDPVANRAPWTGYVVPGLVSMGVNSLMIVVNDTDAVDAENPHY